MQEIEYIFEKRNMLLKELQDIRKYCLETYLNEELCYQDQETAKEFYNRFHNAISIIINLQ